MTEKVVRKTTAKKVVRRTTTKTVSATSSVTKPVRTTTRKAPVKTAVATPKTKRSPKVLIIGFALFFLVMGVSALIGFSDTGQLNVENTIRDRKQNATGDEKEALQSVPTEQAVSGAPNGGLVGTGQVVEEAVVPVATSTVDISASSSLQVASSTMSTETVPQEEVIADAEATRE
jgi:hypothetical protein